jgi:uncharacterized LabA/DUF88 family protein
MRFRVYVDGFNLYYRALKDTPYRWVNLVALASRLLDTTDVIGHVRYFTARIKGRATDPDAPRRQQIYLSALATLPNVTAHYGRFLAKTKTRPLAANPRSYVEILDSEEKGSDVNLAVHLVNDGWRGQYDAALVLSQDTDLAEAMRIVRDELGLKVGLVWLDGRRPNPNLSDVASFVRHVSKADLAASQFPNPIVRQDGTRLHKPESW